MSLTKLSKRVATTILVIFFLFTSHPGFAQQKEQALHNLNTLLINTVMEDLFTPPIASRIYVYPNIAFYECIRMDDQSLPTLTGKLNGLKELPALPTGKKIDNFVAACASFSYVAQSL